MKNRTNTDFSEHVLTIQRDSNIQVYRLQKPNTSCGMVTFINTHGSLIVKGDYGNWIFCREFHPSAEGSVSDYYWCEKLEISSEQEAEKFCPKLTQAKIDRYLNDPEAELTEEEREYLTELRSLAHENQLDYLHYAYRESVGRFTDAESVPNEKKIKPWLLVVFDAFDEICRRMKLGEEVKGMSGYFTKRYPAKGENPTEINTYFCGWDDQIIGALMWNGSEFETKEDEDDSEGAQPTWWLEPVQGEAAIVIDKALFHLWLKNEGWKEHSSKRYWYRSKDHHQWPPDESLTEHELREIYNNRNSTTNEKA